MIIVNTETIPGMKILGVKGLVQGNAVRSISAGRDFMASLKNIFGGELKIYTGLMTEARRQAVERMEAKAEELQANAVVNVRFCCSEVSQGAVEMFAYGTAVVMEKL